MDLPYKPVKGTFIAVFKKEAEKEGLLYKPGISTVVETRGEVVAVGPKNPDKKEIVERYDSSGSLIEREVRTIPADDPPVKVGDVVWARPHSGEQFDFLDGGVRKWAAAFRFGQVSLVGADNE